MLTAIRQYVYNMFEHECTGHDAAHMERVANWSRFLAVREGADPFLAEMCGWLHDVGDKKLFNDPAQNQRKTLQYLESIGCSQDNVQYVDQVISSISYSKGVVSQDLITQVVQDADRLDAIGAIGIARTFAYGGAANQPIYSAKAPSSVGHFYDKLLKLTSLMNTHSAKVEAEKRHAFMLQYLKQFEYEWGQKEAQNE
jgi:uncharacterized protein